MTHAPSDREARAAHYLVALGIALGSFIPALPDTNTLSPRSLATAIALAFVGVGVYLGAPKPEAR